MMRIAAMLLMLMSLACAAAADSTLYTYSNLMAENLYYECEDFTGELPAQLQTALAGRIWANDRILCGAMRSAYLRSDPGREPEQTALVAVMRQGDVLLFGASNESGTWNTCLETDGFLSSAQDFAITVRAAYGGDGRIREAPLALDAGGEEFCVVIRPDGSVELSDYRYAREDGVSFALSFQEGSLWAHLDRDGMLMQEENVQGQIPRRLLAWTYDSIPANMAQARAFAQVNPALLDEGEAMIFGVNFRERDTTESRSMGKYTAKVRLLEKPKDARASWHHVAVGDTQGWVSSTYVLTADMQSRQSQIAENLSQVLDVARADREIALVSFPGESGKQMIGKGTLMHVLARNDGWLHVIIPRGEITWKTDWEGEYGYVQENSVTTGLSIADVAYR